MDEIEKRIEEIQKEIRETPYHKGTQHHIGRLRARLSQLKDQLVESDLRKGGGGGARFTVKKHGDATVVLVGLPSVGKSTLLNALTNAKSPTAVYAFTTVTVIPGMMDYKGAKIQILDVPGLIEGASSGRGRGREVLSVIRSVDLLLIMTEISHEADFNMMKSELDENGVRINLEPPKIKIRKTLSGGLQIRSSAKQELSNETIRGILQQFRYTNAEVVISEKVSMDRLIDALAKNRVWVPALFVVNKVDLQPTHSTEFLDVNEFVAIAISAEKKIGLDELREAIWEKLGLLRVYLKKSNKEVDYDAPLIMHNGDTLNGVAQKVGTEFAKTVKEAKIWGPGSRFPSQRVSFTTRVLDEMEVMFE